MRAPGLRILSWLIPALLAAPAAAAPTLEIRARGDLQVSAERTGDAATRARLMLRDDVGAEVAFARLRIQPRREGLACGAPTSCVTRRDGSCDLRVFGCKADELEVRFDGNGTMDPAEIVARVRGGGASLDVALRVEGGHRIDLEAPDVRLTVTRSSVGADGARVRFLDELGRELLSRSLPRTEAFTAVVPTSALGSPGIGAIVAEVTEPDGSVATARAMVVRQRRTSLSLVTERGRSPALVATLRDSTGPLTRAVVALVCDGRRFADSLSDERGHARFPEPEEDGEHVCHAVFHPNAPGLTAARSAEVRIRRGASRPLLSYLPWISLGLTILAALGFARRGDERDASDAPARSAPAPSVERSAVTKILPTSTTVGFRVLAAEDGQPLGDARVRVDDDPGRPVEPDGFVELELAGRAQATLVFEAEGRAPESVRIRVPHRGEWSDARVRLETTRAHARRAIEVVARAAARDEDEAATMTLREAERRLHSGEDVAFADVAEQQVYGRPPPTLDEARELVRRGRARAARSPTKPRDDGPDPA